MTLDRDARDALVDHWEPGVWVGAVKRAFGPVAETTITGVDEVLIDSHPSHSLMVLWKPPKSPLQPPFLRRFPWMVSITEGGAEAAVGELLRQLPPGARLFMSDHEIDWALMAEIVMLSEQQLAPYHYRELQRFAEEAHADTLEAIGAGYVGAEGSLQRFVRTVPDKLDPSA